MHVGNKNKNKFRTLPHILGIYIFYIGLTHKLVRRIQNP